MLTVTLWKDHYLFSRENCGTAVITNCKVRAWGRRMVWITQTPSKTLIFCRLETYEYQPSESVAVF
jgi:hypothetical protein